MNVYFLGAGFLCFLLGVVHSILGEYLIFKLWRDKGKLVFSNRPKGLKGRHARILWATWHLASFFGWCLSAIILRIAFEYRGLIPEFMNFIICSISYAMFASALLVLIGTKGKHPGWIVLLVIGVLLFIGNS